MNLFSNVLDIASIFYFLIVLLNKKNLNYKKTILFLLVVIIFNTFINENFGNANFLGFILMFIVLIMIYAYLLDEKFHKVLIGSIVAVIITFVIEIAVGNAITMIFDIPPSKLLEANIFRIFGIVVSKGILYLMTRYLIDRLILIMNNSISKSIPIILVGFFNILIIYMAIILFKYMGLNTINDYIYLTVMVSMAIIFSWLIYTISKKIMYQNQQEVIWKIKEEEFYKNNIYIKNMNDILKTIKSQRHDLNNYLSTLYGLIFLDSFEEAKEYIGKINDRISNMNIIVETGHPVITALVSVKKNKAFEDDINMISDINIPEELSFDFVDLSIIIGNLLDNAIEACLVIDKEEKRNIQLSININDENLIIEVINTKCKSIKVDTENIFGEFTTKEHKSNHGLGLGNIKFIVSQYSGTMYVEDLGDEFKVNIVLPIKGNHVFEHNFIVHSV